MRAAPRMVWKTMHALLGVRRDLTADHARGIPSLGSGTPTFYHLAEPLHPAFNRKEDVP